VSDNNIYKVPRWRLALVILALLGLLLLLVWRIVSLQILDTERGYEFLQSQGNARTIRTEPIPAYRGVIMDRNGEPLAVSSPVESIWINPKKLLDEVERWSELAKTVGLSYQALENKVTRNSSREFVYLRRRIEPHRAREIMALDISGVYSQTEYRRFYPAGEVAAQVVGMTNIDDLGQEGIELAYNEWLQGMPGAKRVLKDLYGNIVKDIEPIREARPGNDLTLSIDLRLQYLAYRELKAAVKKYRAAAGSIVLLDVKTGEILAMANQPSYNPNNRQSIVPATTRNRAITDVFEPGSTIKPFTMVMALQSGKFRANSMIDTSPGYLQVGRKTILDPVNYGVISVAKVLAKSSQVGTSKIALALNEQDLRQLLSDVGLGASTGVAFPGESIGVLPNYRKWRAIQRANLGFGYGMSVTTLQLAQAYSVLASGGLHKPIALLKQEKVSPAERVMDEAIAHQVIEMLQGATRSGGTGTRAAIEAYTTAGKTGTVHKVGSQGYEDSRYRSLFAGFAPANNPRIVAVVVVDDPEGEQYHGGEVAAPVFSKVLEGALRILNIAPDDVQELLVAQPDEFEKAA